MTEVSVPIGIRVLGAIRGVCEPARIALGHCLRGAAADQKWRNYVALTKPKVSLAIVFTAIVGMALAAPGLVPLSVLVFGTLGIFMASCSAAALNHVIERRSDKMMARTMRRPLPAGRLNTKGALGFAITLGAGSMILLGSMVSVRCAALTFASLILYGVIYTAWLKRATPLNIVIGGAAGAAPPLLGWVAVTNSIDPQAWVLFLMIFFWTPPHFWALAIARREEYARAGIPMLPVTHGVPYTRRQIGRYSILLVLSSLLPALIGMSGPIYLVAALMLGYRFLYLALELRRAQRADAPMRMFRYSITYLMSLFGALLVDHYLCAP
jgi:protoheme IX farnesyltransferase